MYSPLSISQNVLKFRLSSGKERSVLESIQSNLPKFEFDEGFSPTIISNIYFDTRDLAFGHQAISNPQENTRLRAREYYYSSSNGFVHKPHVWVEVKVTNINSVRKKRFRIPKEFLGRLWGGEDVRDPLIKSNTEESGVALEHYNELRETLADRGFVPTVSTCYTRHVYQHQTNGLRLTLDHDISYHIPPGDLYETFETLSRERMGRELDRVEGWILEVKGPEGGLKDIDSLPDWLAQVVDETILTFYSKYRSALSRLLEEEALP
ncbi:VTC domain-containing protein [Thermodesulfobacteriota bacterium]